MAAHQQIKEPLISIFHAQFAFLRSKLKGLESWLVQLLEKLTHLEKSYEQSSKQMMTLQDKCKSLTDTYQPLQNSMNTLEGLLENCLQAIEDRDRRLQALEAQVKRLSEQPNGE